MTAYWFARYSDPNVYGWRVVRPVSVEGWLVFMTGIAAMVAGGAITIVVGGDQVARGWLGLGYGAWLLACIAAMGMVINWKADPAKTAEMYTAERAGKMVGERK
jgi:uncharacterized membrane protein